MVAWLLVPDGTGLSVSENLLGFSVHSRRPNQVLLMSAKYRNSSYRLSETGQLKIGENMLYFQSSNTGFQSACAHCGILVWAVLSSMCHRDHILVCCINKCKNSGLFPPPLIKVTLYRNIITSII